MQEALTILTVIFQGSQSDPRSGSCWYRICDLKSKHQKFLGGCSWCDELAKNGYTIVRPHFGSKFRDDHNLSRTFASNLHDTHSIPTSTRYVANTIHRYTFMKAEGAIGVYSIVSTRPAKRLMDSSLQPRLMQEEDGRMRRTMRCF